MTGGGAAPKGGATPPRPWGAAAGGFPTPSGPPGPGLEAYFVDDRRVRDHKVERNHLTLLAADDEGFRNLVELSSAGFLEGLHRGKPGVDLELLARHADGVICLTGCLASRSSRRIVDGRPAEARAHRSEERRVGKEWRSRWAPYH